MQFFTLREPKEGEHKHHVSGGRPMFGPFRFRVVPDASIERVSVSAVAVANAHDFDAVVRFIGNIAEGVQVANEHEGSMWGECLCCVRIEITDMKSHPTDTTADWMFIQGGSLTRDLLGRFATPISPFRAEWLTSDVVALARGIHTNAALDGLPALCDALIEAGCDDPLVIEHLQTCPDHAPSCWVVEMILDQIAAR